VPRAAASRDAKDNNVNVTK